MVIFNVPQGELRAVVVVQLLGVGRCHAGVSDKETACVVLMNQETIFAYAKNTFHLHIISSPWLHTNNVFFLFFSLAVEQMTAMLML